MNWNKQAKQRGLFLNLKEEIVRLQMESLQYWGASE